MGQALYREGGEMITADQAKNLAPGTKVWLQTYTIGGGVWSEWIVYEPEPQHRWDSDPTILNYIFDPYSGLKGYLLSDQLYKYSLTRRY